MIEMFEKRLARWKIDFLSKGGRLTLIKSILTNLPIYFLSAVPILVKVAKKLGNIQCHLLWGDNEINRKYQLVKKNESNRKYHLVKWKDVKKLVNKGGLGSRSWLR